MELNVVKAVWIYINTKSYIYRIVKIVIVINLVQPCYTIQRKALPQILSINSFVQALILNTNCYLSIYLYDNQDLIMVYSIID